MNRKRKKTFDFRRTVYLLNQKIPTPPNHAQRMFAQAMRMVGPYEFLDPTPPTALVLKGSIYVPENVTHIGHRLLEAIPVFIMIHVVFMDEFGCI